MIANIMIPFLPWIHHQFDFLQNYCLNLWTQSHHINTSQALFCGKQIESQELKNLYIETGLIHVLVVSASHLNFFSRIIFLVYSSLESIEKAASRIFNIKNNLFYKNKNIIFVKKTALTVLLLLFALITGWQPPVVRALIEYFIKTSLKNRPQIFLIFWSWIICITIHPQWVMSKSLILSVLARILLILLPQTSSKIFDVVIASFVFYFGLSFLLNAWSDLSLFVYTFALILATPTVLLLFTVGIIELIFPLGISFTNELYQLHFVGLKKLSMMSTLKLPTKNLDYFKHEIFSTEYLILLFTIIYTGKILHNRYNISKDEAFFESKAAIKI